MRRPAVLAVLLAAVAAVTVPAQARPPGAGGVPYGLPQAPDPDVPPQTAPVATVTAFQDETYRETEGTRTKRVAMPRLPKGRAGWDRIVVVFTGVPDGDPWDRLFGVAVGNAEVIRGTTPRTSFTVRKDVTELAALFPSGARQRVSMTSGAYEGGQKYTVRFEFYLDEPTARFFTRAKGAVGVFAFASIDGDGKYKQQRITFPKTAPAAAYVDVTLSGHTGTGEFWYLPEGGNSPDPRTFHVYVDGVEVGAVIAMPYVYALLGFGGATGTTLHPLMWWTGQQALDQAGVHTGTGEIPPYRIEVPPDKLALFTGRRLVQVVQENGGPRWVTSLRVVFP